jgi:hypothetical protein
MRSALGPFSSRCLLLVGVLLLVAGYLVLLGTDRMGRNWASHLAPILILSGLALAAVGALRKE